MTDASERKTLTAQWQARRLRRHSAWCGSLLEVRDRADAFQAYADVEFGEAEALLRVERSA